MRRARRGDKHLPWETQFTSSRLDLYFSTIEFILTNEDSHCLVEGNHIPTFF